MKLCRPLVPLQIRLSRKDLVAAVDLARPGPSFNFLLGRRLFLRGFFLFFWLRKATATSAINWWLRSYWTQLFGLLTVCFVCALTMSNTLYLLYALSVIFKQIQLRVRGYLRGISVVAEVAASG
jgi:hypothetical protein